MICSTLTPNHSGKENPCYTQIRLQKIRILEIRELHNGWLQCGLVLLEGDDSGQCLVQIECLGDFLLFAIMIGQLIGGPYI